MRPVRIVSQPDPIRCVNEDSGSRGLAQAWIPKQTVFFDLQRQPIDLESLFRSGELPAIHRDPFDRLLCGQAMTHDLIVLTPDLPFQGLGAKTLW
jgi:PIN domain nuclease of toxin-antitoxin system